jgi:hypothetical protein
MKFFYVSFQNKKKYIFGFNNSILEENKNIYGNAFIPSSAQIIPCLSYCPAGIMVISMQSTKVKQFL